MQNLNNETLTHLQISWWDDLRAKADYLVIWLIQKDKRRL